MTGDLLYQMCHRSPVWPWAIGLKSLGLFYPHVKWEPSCSMSFVENCALHKLQTPHLSTLCLLTETRRSPAQESRGKTLSIPGMGIPTSSVTSLRINFGWIKRIFVLNCLSHFVLAWSRLHTLCRHPEHFWCSGACLGAWPRFIHPLASHCPTISHISRRDCIELCLNLQLNLLCDPLWPRLH